MQHRPDDFPAPGSRPRAAPRSCVLRLENAGFSVGALDIVAGIDLEIESGPPTVVMGPNGCGKTTLLKLMMGLIEPSTGRVAFAAGDDPAADGVAAVRRAIVFQKPVMLRRTAAANVAFALRAAKRPADAGAVLAALDQVGLSALATRSARRLSGGEQQRLALARALARDPTILFLDEPTASLDPGQTKVVEDIIERVAESGVKIVMTTHDIGEAKRLAGDVVFLARGRLIEHAPATRFFLEPATAEVRRFLAGDLVL